MKSPWLQTDPKSLRGVRRQQEVALDALLPGQHNPLGHVQPLHCPQAPSTPPKSVRKHKAEAEHAPPAQLRAFLYLHPGTVTQ